MSNYTFIVCSCAILLAICLVDENIPLYISLQAKLLIVKLKMLSMRMRLEMDFLKIRLNKRKYIEWAKKLEKELKNND